MPKQVVRRLVVLYLGRTDQGAQDDPRLVPVNADPAAATVAFATRAGFPSATGSQG